MNISCIYRDYRVIAPGRSVDYNLPSQAIGLHMKERIVNNNKDALGLGLVGCGDFGRFCLEAFEKLPCIRLSRISSKEKLFSL